MIDPLKAAKEQVEASFDGFITDSEYGLYGLIAFLLVVRACNFSVENDSFPAYNGEQYSRYNLNLKVVIMKTLHIKLFEEIFRKQRVRQNTIDLKDV